MTVLAPLLPAAGLALGGLFGGSGSSPPQVQAPQVNFTPTGFQGGGLTGTFANNAYGISPSADRMAAVGGVASTFGQQAQDIAGIRSQWAPGASALRSSLMSALQANRTQALGNLRDSLAQRRVLGSSFAQASLASADQQYQQQIQQVQAQTFLQELQAQQQLIQQQYTAARGQFQTHLDEMNLEAGLAADLTGRASTALASAANTQAQLNLQAQTTNANMQSQSQQGMGKFFGGLGQMFGQGLSGMMGSSAAGSAGSTAIADSLGLGSGISDADLIASLALV